MKHRTKAEAWSAEAAKIVTKSRRCQRAVAALVRHYRDRRRVPRPELRRFGDFSELQIKAIETIARKTARGGDFDPWEFAEAMDRTAPALARARTTDSLGDLWRMLAQPEVIDLWAKWGARTGARGRDPGYFAKALLVDRALGASPYFTRCHRDLVSGDFGKRRLVYDWLEWAASTRTGRKPQQFGEKVYKNAMKQVGLVVDQQQNRFALTTDEVVSSNIHLLRALARIHPDVGVRYAIDATDVTAWVRQLEPQDTPELERQIRRRAVNASFRAYTRDGVTTKAWRGYNLVALLDLASGVAGPWGLFPAGEGFSEYKALMYLLAELFEKWPDSPIDSIVADRAWDQVAAVRDCALLYGIRLIVGRDESSWNRKPTVVASETIRSFDGRGVVFCRHGAMRRAGLHFVGPRQRNERGLDPGDPAPERDFRLRLACQAKLEPCPGKPHLYMSRDWPALSPCPHTSGVGRDDLHAFRLAMESRRNWIESLYSAVKGSHMQALAGAARTRTDNEFLVETLLSLTLFLRTAFVVASEREVAGVIAADPPPRLAAALASRPAWA